MKSSPDTRNIVKNDETLRHYEMLECLSYRRTRESVLMRDKRTDRLVVAKIFYPEDELFERKQTDAIRSCSFAGIPEFIEEIADEEKRVEIREYVPGRSLDREVTAKDLGVKEIRDIILKLCDILEKLHDREEPIVHRDLKPQNIVVNETGDVFLIDFDIARVVKENGETEEPATDTVVIGTQMFAAPEQYGFSQTDARSDIYSLGVLIRWLLKNTAASREGQKDSKEYRTLEAVADRCSEIDPKRRYQKISHVRNAVTRKRRKTAVVSCAVPGILAAVIFAVLLLSGKARENTGFEEPLFEEAVRLQVGKTRGEPISEEDFLKVEDIFVVFDRAYATEEEYYEAVRALDLADRKDHGGLRKLSDAKKLKNLKRLCVAYEMITDLTALSGNTKLEKLELKNNLVEDIEVVKKLPELGSLGLCSNPVRDIAPACSCKKLLYLDLCNANGYDPAAIADLPHLEYLDINNRTTSYRYLSGVSIRRLRLGNVNTDNLRFLLEIKDLETVEVHFLNAGLIRELGETPFTVVYD